MSVLVERSEETGIAFERDFGGLVRGHCDGLVRPQQAGELVEIVRHANACGTTLTPRGGGLSQSGQSVPVGSVVVSTEHLDAVHVDEQSVRCGSGARFRQVLETCVAAGRVPRALPLNLDLTVGGVLSAGGFGSGSHRHGLVVSTVRSIDVVLGSGERVQATEGEVRDAVLGGVGRCGIIVEAALETRPLPRGVRTHFLLYDDFDAFVHDQSVLRDRTDHLEAFCTCAVQGLRLGSTGRRPFARWFYAIHASTESELDDAEVLRDLSYREHLGSESTTASEHAARYDLRFAVMRATGGWAQAHPWLEAFVPRQALPLIPELLSELPVFLDTGHRLSVLDLSNLPSGIAVPDSDSVYAFAILPTGVPSAFVQSALASLRTVHDRLLEAGAKRYLSGWLFDPNEADFRRHFAGKYARWGEWKRRFDPRSVLRSHLFPQ